MTALVSSRLAFLTGSQKYKVVGVPVNASFCCAMIPSIRGLPPSASAQCCKLQQFHVVGSIDVCPNCSGTMLHLPRDTLWPSVAMRGSRCNLFRMSGQMLRSLHSSWLAQSAISILSTWVGKHSCHNSCLSSGNVARIVLLW